MRNPQRVTKSALRLWAVNYDTESASDFYDDLVSAILDPANSTEAAKLAACKTLAEAFKAGDDWIADVDALDALLPDYVGLYDWFQVNLSSLTIASVTAKLGGVEVLDPSVALRVWDNLFARLILGGDGRTRTALMEVLVLNYLVDNHDDSELVTNLDELKAMINGRVVLPREVFPLPGAGITSVTPEPPSEPVDRQALLDEFALHQAALDELENLRWKLEETLKLEPLEYEATEEGNNDPVTYPSPRFELTAGQIAGLSEETQDILAGLEIAEGTRLAYAIQTLERRLAKLGDGLIVGVEKGKRVVATGGGVWEASPARFGEGEEECDSANIPDLGSDYKMFYGGDAKCKIKPLGIADLLRVEQKLCCYAPGEVAHIENILQGEYKERATRRLRRVEETFVSITEKETLDERDTITTEQHEMQNAASEVVQEDISLNIGMVAGYHGPTFDVSLNSAFATSTSTNTSNTSSTVYAQSVTNRALQRIVERKREERIRKVIDEYEETQKHGLDNRGGTAHVVGLYRWADKIYEAKLVNYGKRLMFEFLIPEPAAFHLWAMSKPSAGNAVEITEPVNHQTGVQQYGLPPLSEKSIYRHQWHIWSWLYNVALDEPPALEVTVSHSKASPEVDGNASVAIVELAVPKGYKAKEVYVAIAFRPWSGSVGSPCVTLQVGPDIRNLSNNNRQNFPVLNGEVDFVPVSVIGTELHHLALNMTMKCEVLPAHVTAWQKECYEKILAAYNAQKAAYDEALAQAKAGYGNGIFGTNPAINREIERTELRKACINALFYGNDFSSDAIANYGSDDDCKPPIAETDCCAVYEGERAKFLEQVFDWNFMSYIFYPYFHGKRCRWKMLYQLQDNDPEFLKFLQAGMARVLVPVRLGFEEPAMHFLSSGQIWGTGQVPALKSDLYLSIVQELMGAVMYTGEVVSPTWEVRVPTSLTVLQCESGCIDGSGLPCECGTGIGTGTSTMVGGGDGDGDPATPG